ncbi:MAG: glycosyltransferase family 4 protein [Nitrospiraceae bacterium]
MSWISFLKRVISPAVRRRLDWLLRPLWALPRCIVILLGERPQGGRAQVFYGHGRIPDPHDQIHGGLVKFQRMQDEFPNSPRRFNVLYMVSSRMPYGGEYVAWCARKKGMRIVWNQNGVAYPSWYGPGWEQINAPMARLHADADYVFYQSQFCKLSADRFLGERQGPWEILYNSVDTKLFAPATSDPDPDQLVLLLGGTQYQYYRLDCALRVLAALIRHGIKARLLVTGRLSWMLNEEEAGRQAEELVKRLGLQGRVRFLGPYTQVDAPSIFRQAHILLHTKVNDPCPGLVVEAMACGLPVVYSSSGGLPELVGDQAGVGVPAELDWNRDVPPDSESMANAIVQVVRNRDRYAQAARRRAMERFDLQPWLARHREVFATVLR